MYLKKNAKTIPNKDKSLSHLSSQDNPYLCSYDVNPPNTMHLLVYPAHLV